MKNTPISKILFAVTVTAGTVFICWSVWFWINLALPNYGWEFGYYGQFNRVKHVIEDMPRVQIVDHWVHEDISLEDFGYTLMVDGGRKVNVNFYDGTPEKSERSKSKLRAIIQAQVAASKAVNPRS